MNPVPPTDAGWDGWGGCVFPHKATDAGGMSDRDRRLSAQGHRCGRDEPIGTAVFPHKATDAGFPFPTLLALTTLQKWRGAMRKRSRPTMVSGQLATNCSL